MDEIEAIAQLYGEVVGLRADLNLGIDWLGSVVALSAAFVMGLLFIGIWIRTQSHKGA